jgi:hypothetical protein
VEEDLLKKEKLYSCMALQLFFFVTLILLVLGGGLLSGCNKSGIEASTVESTITLEKTTTSTITLEKTTTSTITLKNTTTSTEITEGKTLYYWCSYCEYWEEAPTDIPFEDLPWMIDCPYCDEDFRRLIYR